jgi:hypothetical protein
VGTVHPGGDDRPVLQVAEQALKKRLTHDCQGH